MAGTVPMTGTAGSSSARRAPSPCTEAVLQATTIAAGSWGRVARAEARMSRWTSPGVRGPYGMWSGSSDSTSPRSGRSAWRASAYPRSPRPLSTKATRLVDLGSSGRSPVRGPPVSDTPTSVHRRVVGEAGDVREAVALAPQHLAPQPVGLGGERVAHLGVDDVPVPPQHLALELARLPPGVAGEDAKPRQLGRDHGGGHVEVDEPDRAEEPLDPERLGLVARHGHQAQRRRRRHGTTLE